MVIMANKKLIKYINTWLILVICISCNSCVLLFTSKGFKPSEQRALFSADYNPDVDNKLKKGLYLPYDESHRKFVKGEGFILYPDGRVESKGLSLDYLKMDDATAENIKRLADAGFITDYTVFEDGIYTVKDDKLYLDLYSVLYRKHWDLLSEDYTVIDDVTVVSDNDNLNYSGKRITYRCIPLTDPIAPQQGSSKNQKWMWRNKTDWKNYKKN